MQTAIICLGRLKELHFRAAADEYIKRLRRFVRMEETELSDEPEPDPPSPALVQKVMDKEAVKLLEKVKPGDYVIALCIDGKEWDSVDFANHLQGLQDKGAQRIVFLIGGSLGLGEAALKRADEKLSLSRMTFPHALARVLLLEQLYRAAKINAGERYHK